MPLLHRALAVTTGGARRFVIRVEGGDGPDRLATDGGRVASWSDLQALRFYAARQRWELAGQSPAAIDLDAAAGWVEGSVPMDPGALLDVWNLCWAVAHSVDTTFDHRRSQRDDVYDTLFWAANAPYPKDALPEDAWTEEDLEVLRDVLTEGISLAQAALTARR